MQAEIEPSAVVGLDNGGANQILNPDAGEGHVQP
jgi:hypothetical protein